MSNPSWFTPKTHCLRGHKFTPENTYVRDDGRKRCRECNRVRRRMAKHHWPSRKVRRPKSSVIPGLLAFARLPVVSA